MLLMESEIFSSREMQKRINNDAQKRNNTDVPQQQLNDEMVSTVT